MNNLLKKKRNTRTKRIFFSS